MDVASTTIYEETNTTLSKHDHADIVIDLLRSLTFVSMPITRNKSQKIPMHEVHTVTHEEVNDFPKELEFCKSYMHRYDE